MALAHSDKTALTLLVAQAEDLDLGLTRSSLLRLPKDLMSSDASPPNGWRFVDGDYLESGATIGAAKRPGHLENARRSLDIFDA